MGYLLERGLIELGGGGLIEFLRYFVSLVQTHNDLAIPYAEHTTFFLHCMLVIVVPVTNVNLAFINTSIIKQ